MHPERSSFHLRRAAIPEAAFLEGKIQSPESRTNRLPHCIRRCSCLPWIGLIHLTGEKKTSKSGLPLTFTASGVGLHDQCPSPVTTGHSIKESNMLKTTIQQTLSFHLKLLIPFCQPTTKVLPENKTTQQQQRLCLYVIISYVVCYYLNLLTAHNSKLEKNKPKKNKTRKPMWQIGIAREVFSVLSQHVRAGMNLQCSDRSLIHRKICLT